MARINGCLGKNLLNKDVQKMKRRPKKPQLPTTPSFLILFIAYLLLVYF